MLIKAPSFFLCLQLVLLLSGCAINSTQPTKKLNMYHMDITSASDSNRSFNGVFCADNSFFGLEKDASSPPIRIAILKNYEKSKTDYYENISGGIILYDTNSQKNISGKILLDYPVYQKQCGIGKMYPYIYTFRFSLQIQSHYEDKNLEEQKKIITQLRKNKYLDIVSVKPPYMSVTKPILVSEHPVRLYFTNEQIRELFSDKE